MHLPRSSPATSNALKHFLLLVILTNFALCVSNS